MSGPIRAALPIGQRGSAFIAAITLLVILSLLGAYLARIAASSQMGAAQDIQGARGWQAARAGLEWGLYQVQDPTNALGTALPSCPATTGLSIEGFTVSVSCTAYGPYTEGTRSTRVFALVSTATFGTAGSPGYVERQAKATVGKCRDPSNTTSPAYACE